MDRRELLSGLFALGGHHFTQRPASSSSGDTRLEDTNLSSLTKLLQNDLARDGLPIPKTFNLFPYRNNRPQYDDTTDNIIGEDTKLQALNIAYETFQQKFFIQPSCNKRALFDESKSWRIFVALHEIGHHVAINLKNGDLSVLDRTYSKVMGIEPQSAADYLSARLREVSIFAVHEANEDDYKFFLKTLQNPNHDSATVSFFTYKRVHERVADTAAVLYLLSNYKDVRDNPVFIDHIIDLRTALFTDPFHSSADTIRTAVDTFRKRPVIGMSITEATKMAGSIVANLPQQEMTTEQKAQLIRTDIYNRYRLMMNQGDIDVSLKEEAFAARNRLCRVATAAIRPGVS